MFGKMLDREVKQRNQSSKLVGSDATAALQHGNQTLPEIEWVEAGVTRH